MAAKPVALLHLAPLAGGGVKKMPGGHLYPRASTKCLNESVKTRIWLGAGPGHSYQWSFSRMGGTLSKPDLGYYHYFGTFAKERL